MPRMDTDEPLRTWAGLNEHINTLDEAECWALLAAEKKGKRRVSFMLRIYGRANRLRTESERKELVTLAATA